MDTLYQFPKKTSCETFQEIPVRNAKVTSGKVSKEIRGSIYVRIFERIFEGIIGKIFLIHSYFSRRIYKLIPGGVLEGNLPRRIFGGISGEFVLEIFEARRNF